MIIYLLLIAATVFAGYGRYRDIISSRNFLYYGGREGNSFNKDEYGLFKSAFNITGSTLLILGLVVCGLIWSNALIPAILALLIIAIPSLTIGMNNDKNNEYRREKIQIPTLRHIRANGKVPSSGSGEAGKEGDMELQGFPIGNPTRYFYRPFSWIYSTDTNEEAARVEINSKLVELSQKPETEWFPR